MLIPLGYSVLQLVSSYRPLGAEMGRAARSQWAVRTAVVDPGDELRPGGRLSRLADPVAPLVASLGCQRVLFAFGRTRGPGLAQVQQPRTARLIALSYQTLGHRQLVGGQLGMSLCVVLADWRLAGLDVDDDQPAGGVAFDPIDPSAQPHACATSGVEHSLDVAFEAPLGQPAAGLGPPRQERLDHRAMARQLVG